jgi:hypothetical protein
LCVVGLFVPLVLAPSAFGQGATLVIDDTTATRGQTVNVTGSAFNASNANIASGVSLRFDTRDAEPLVTTSPSGQGTITASFVVPPNTPLGEHLLIATQTSVRGRHTFGGPGRAKLTVIAGKSAAAGWSPLGLPPAGFAGALLGLLAVAGGAGLAIRRLRMPARTTQPNFSR